MSVSVYGAAGMGCFGLFVIGAIGIVIGEAIGISDNVAFFGTVFLVLLALCWRQFQRA